MSLLVAQRNAGHERGRLILSVAGIATALMLILLLMGFRTGLYATMSAFIDHVGADLLVAQSGVEGLFSSGSALPLALHDTVVAEAGAAEAGHLITASIIFTRGPMKTPVLLIGYDPQLPFAAPWKLAAGRHVRGDDEIALDSWLAERSGIVLGDRIQVLGRTFTVVGLTRETASWMSPYLFITLDAAQAALGLTNTVSYHLLRLPRGADATGAARRIEAALAGVEVLTPEQIAAADQRVIASVMDTPIVVMIGISTIIGIAVIGLTAYTAVTDQRRTYGVLKAVGASPAALARLVVAETLYRTALGYLLGVGMALVAARLIMALWPQFTVVVPFVTIVQAGLLAFGMAVVAVLLPLRQVQRLDPQLVFKA